MTDGDISETDFRADGQCQKSSIPIRMSAAETTYPTTCIRWMR